MTFIKYSRGREEGQVALTNLLVWPVCPIVPPDIVYGGDTSADLAVAEGDNATLSCRATGHPPPRVSWRREDGEPIIIRSSTAGKSRRRNIEIFMILSICLQHIYYYEDKRFPKSIFIADDILRVHSKDFIRLINNSLFSKEKGITKVTSMLSYYIMPIYYLQNYKCC